MACKRCSKPLPTGKERLLLALFPNQKLVVEFHGDWWHANPRLYKPDDLVGTRAEDVWAKDARRKTALEAAGYRVHIIWEQDWNDCHKTALESVKSELEKFVKEENRPRQRLAFV